jgi:hypothetical protein
MVMEVRRRILRVRGVGVAVDGEGPGFGLVGGFVRAALGGQVAAFAGEFVLRKVEGVAVEGAGGGVHPDGRRCGRSGDDLAEEEGGEDAGVDYLAAIFRGIAAVDAAPGEVDDGVGTVELGDPRARCEAVPEERLPGCGGGLAREDGDGVAGGVEVACEDGADLAGASGDEDAHGCH